MIKKRIIRKITVLVAWTMVIAGIGALLLSANKKEGIHACRAVQISLKGSGDKLYVERSDIEKMLEGTAYGTLIGTRVEKIDLAKMEKVLEYNSWIRNAELYFDKNDMLHVFVEEREPVARIFTTGGYSFYIDSSGYKLPLLQKMSIRLPVFTGFMHGGEWSRKDSLLLQEIKEVAVFLYENEFWNAQIGQIDITQEGNFELIPVIGDHLIRIGRGEKVGEKLQRLYVFYKQVLSKTGFSRYAVLDAQFDGQIVAVKKGPVDPVDSVRLQKNIEELVNRATLRQMEVDMLPGQTQTPRNKDSLQRIPVRGASEPEVSGETNRGDERNSRGSNVEQNSGNRTGPKAVMPNRQ